MGEVFWWYNRTPVRLRGGWNRTGVRLYGVVVLIALLAGRLDAQLSPGDLSNAHKDLEGVSNCTQCHDIGNKVPNNKCLNCHKEIKTRLDRNEGFHASSEVRNQDCARCHSDHHGRKFDMVRFDEKKFNHTATGYELMGAHKRIDCRQCHQADNVDDVNLKKRPETFLGLKQNCASCHEDRHQKTLGNDCAKCHTTEVFKPAGKFNHDKTDFALAGKHKTVACIECHLKETKNGAEYQRFSGLAFKNCNSCHADAHKNNLGANCKECHSEQSFQALGKLNKFNHSKTPFALKGKHKQTDCKQCHNLGATPLTVFQDRHGVKTENCSTCHKDVHEGKFGNNCAECHNENSFGKVGNLDVFDHTRTNFALEGKHETVDCRKCHTSESMTDPLPHTTCASCHTDFHEGQFVNQGVGPDCRRCHTVDGFSESLFTLEDHGRTKFPLTGAHVATPCFACHRQEEKWTFKGLGERCVDCHKDVHAGQIAEKWYPDHTCTQCHNPAGWRENKFDHSQTAFKLQGVHARQECRNCHISDAEHPYGQFAGLPTACSSCHEDVHEGQFVVDGAVNCAKCHGLEGWTIKRFDHNKTRFKLTGKHVVAKCVDCHQEVTQNDKTYVQYKYNSIECVVCHR